MVLLKSRIILVYDLLEIRSKTTATQKSSVFVCLQRLCCGVSNGGFPGRSLDTEMSGGCVAGGIRNTQCSRLLVVHLWFLDCFYFPPLEVGVKRKTMLQVVLLQPRTRGAVSLQWCNQNNPWIGGFCFRDCIPSCFLLGKLLLSHVLGGCAKWEFCSAVACWFRSILNAISPAISCASSQLWSLCSCG